MGAGDFDRRIILQEPIPDQGSAGEPVETFAEWQAVWAQLVTVGGGESFASGQRFAQQTTQFRIRYRDGVTPQMRVVYRSKFYKIEDVGEPDRDRTIILTCTILENVSGEGS